MTATGRSSRRRSRSPGPQGRVVVVAGEAGIGKTALVTVGDRGAGAAARALGRLRPAHHAAAARPAARRRPRRRAARCSTPSTVRGARGVLRRRWTSSPAAVRARRRGPALGRRRHARPRRAAGPPARALARLPRPDLPQRRAARAARGAPRPRRAAARVRAADRAGGAVRGRPSRCLARRAGPRAVATCTRSSGGNPFFVTEVLARARRQRVPASVRDAVALRVAALGAARASGRRAGRGRPRARPSCGWSPRSARRPRRSTSASTSGLLEPARRDAVAFRHDLARRAVEDGDLARCAGASSTGWCCARSRRAGGADPARLAHHARRAGDAAAIRRLAPGRRARRRAPRGGHRAGARALGGGARGGGDADTPSAPQALEGVAVEAYLCGRPERALEARRALLALHEAAGERARRRRRPALALAHPLVVGPRDARRPTVGDRAIAVLEAFPDSRELAMALSGRSQLAMLGRAHATRRSRSGRAPSRWRAGSTTARRSRTG